MEQIQRLTNQSFKIFPLFGTLLGVMGAIPASFAQSPSQSPIQISQLFYPSSSEQAAIKVLGQGQVSLPADVAKLEFQVSGSSAPAAPETPQTEEAEESEPEAENPDSTSPETPESMTPEAPTLVLGKEDVAPIVNALKAAGVAQSAIEVLIEEGSSSGFPFPFPGSDAGAKIRVRVANPTRDRLQQIVKAANSAASKSETLSISKVNVQYITTDCGKLAQAAYTAAVQDAQKRATAIATAMGVRLSGAPSVAESSLYDLFVPLCTENSELPSFLPFGDLSSAYEPDAPPQVQLRRDLFMSFPVQTRQ